MEVILLERIDKLGQMGDVVTVKSGYARNFLLPQKKALRATEANKRHFEEQRAQFEARNLEQRDEAEVSGKKLDGLTVTMIRQAGDAGQLYGSVNARDIADAVTQAGFTVNRQQVALDHPIKALGLHGVRIALHPEVAVEVVANVARTGDEAKVQLKTGKAVVSGEEAREPEAAAADEKKPVAEAIKEEVSQAEEKADEAVVEQAEKVFEEGAAPTIEPEPADEDEGAAEAEAGGAETGGDEPAKENAKEKKSK